MQEEWRDVVGYEGWYIVSNYGRVRRVKRGRGARIGRDRSIVLNGQRNGSGRYPSVKLCASGRAITRSVHSLVAAAFIGPRPDGYQINHKDGNKLNPRLDNLEYVTAERNARHAQDSGLFRQLRGEQHGNAFLTDDDVTQIRRRSLAGESLSSLAAEYGCSKTSAGNYRRGEGRAAALH